MRLWIWSMVHTPKATTCYQRGEASVFHCQRLCTTGSWLASEAETTQFNLQTSNRWHQMINKKKGETKHWQQSQTYKHVLYVPCMYLRFWCNHKSAGLYHFLKTFSGKSAAHEWSLLVLLLVVWAADFSWVLTCAVWLHAEVMLFSLCFGPPPRERAVNTHLRPDNAHSTGWIHGVIRPTYHTVTQSGSLGVGGGRCADTLGKSTSFDTFSRDVRTAGEIVMLRMLLADVCLSSHSLASCQTEYSSLAVPLMTLR